MNLKYHYVFFGSTINNLVENKPKTMEQLFNIKGLGDVKINKYGNDILKIIEEHAKNAEDIKEKVKPFMIFKDEQIDELIRAKPKTKDQLLKVKGFGEMKVEKYGEGILNIFSI